MTLSPLMALLVLSAALMHAGWNVMAKTAGDKLLNIGLISVGLGVVGLVFTPFVDFPDRASWHFLLGSLVAHLGYYVFLSTGYRHGDLSQVYPIARGMAPPLVAFTAWLLIGETLTPLQLTGVLATSFGILSLALDRPLERAHSWRPILFGLLTSLTIMSYTLFDGQGVRVAGDHFGYIVWLFVLDVPLVLAYCLWRRPGALGYFRQRWRFGLIGGVLSGGAYGISIFAMSQGGLASVSSLRETSVIFAAVMSSLLLKERFRHRRYVSVVLVATGAVLLH
ncbi:MAG TPA: EamA family transporter [Terriglobales bacterium]|nr:EamA family transporter [Terriglobales bacterium]